MRASEAGLTRAAIRKRRLVWAKTAPMHAPHYVLLRTSRYIPVGCKSARGFAVYDRELERRLSDDELVRVRDCDLVNARIALN